MAPVAVNDLESTVEASTTPSKVINASENGPVSNATLEATTSDEPHTAIFNRMPWRPPVAVRGQGIYFDLEDGSRILDAVGGAAVACIGNGHPKVVKAIGDQLQELSYVYNMQLSNRPSEALARRLIEGSEGAFEHTFFVSGGSEAMEAALKLARQYFFEIGQPNRKYFITRQLSYHGNTLGALAISHHPARRAPYEAILNQDLARHVSPVYYKRFAKEGESEEDYVSRLAKEVEDLFEELGPGNVVAFVAEPVSGASQGVTYAPKGYFAAISAICRRHGALLIWDEVMCGMGRMGTTLHSWQNPNSFTDGISPDIQAIAKGLGGGYGSIGAVLLNKKVADGIKAGSGYLMHGHTYQAHPLAVAASYAVQDVLKEENLLERAAQVGTYLEKLLKEKLTGSDAISAPYIFDIRGAGCFWGVEFHVSEEAETRWFTARRLAGWVQAVAMKNGLVIMGMSGGIDGKRGDVAILAPAYNTTNAEIDELVQKFVKSVEEVLLQTVLS
ncbi:hypothetical protein M408DRAFT_216434 [Serendipita vermifera MAFF 305830]|uniref:Aminotransferase class III n=1 Tax=Serendipita vermifera MAFF 305830 TaxID=933852 RepID=A0A0C2XTR6_SERVB|nr:hypothetical protein M408DRAFT_216434 [Serendipita vermifera MAFF 305830]